MLDDLYALPETGDVATDDAPTRAPEWSSSEALDEAFASWVPGPSAGATALERSMVADAPVELAYSGAGSSDEWLVDTEPVVAEAVAAVRHRWTPSDDDILPARRGRRR